MEACLTVLRWAPPIPDLWRMTDALSRITTPLAAHPDGAFLPPIAPDDPNHALRARTALASTLLAGLELARAGQITLDQPRPWDTIHLHRAPAGRRVV